MATRAIEPTQPPRLKHVPALDGLRGLAVGAVLVFHGGFSVLRGGFLGVSLFFTLSGFLITSLLLAEHQNTGRIHLGAFWSRRFRRLLPASWLTLVAIVITALLTLMWVTPRVRVFVRVGVGG